MKNSLLTVLLRRVLAVTMPTLGLLSGCGTLPNPIPANQTKYLTVCASGFVSKGNVRESLELGEKYQYIGSYTIEGVEFYVVQLKFDVGNRLYVLAHSGTGAISSDFVYLPSGDFVSGPQRTRGKYDSVSGVLKVSCD